MYIWIGIEVVITALTRNQVVAQAARGFESHPIRQKRDSRMGVSFCIKGFEPPYPPKITPAVGFFRLPAFLFQFAAKPKPFLNLLHGNTVCRRQRGTAIPEIVKAHPAQSVFLLLNHGLLRHLNSKKPWPKTMAFIMDYGSMVLITALLPVPCTLQEPENRARRCR